MDQQGCFLSMILKVEWALESPEELDKAQSQADHRDSYSVCLRRVKQSAFNRPQGWRVVS